jgi:hypothetical protein
LALQHVASGRSGGPSDATTPLKPPSDVTAIFRKED